VSRPVEKMKVTTPLPVRPHEQSSPGVVVVVDDHALLAESVVMTLRASGFNACRVDSSVAFDSPNLVEAVLDRHPSLVLLDLFLGEQPDVSFAALSSFAAASVPVLVVTATNSRFLHAQCLEAGAVGIVEKSSSIETLIDAVAHTLRSESVMSRSRSVELLSELASVRRKAEPASLLLTLTPRERDVLQALTLGHPAGRIARDNQTSIVTVRTHIRSVLLKLNVHSQLEAVSMAMRQNWFD
jgi:DNA-binding NarL/FixJ family response regulator